MPLEPNPMVKMNSSIKKKIVLSFLCLLAGAFEIYAEEQNNFQNDTVHFDPPFSQWWQGHSAIPSYLSVSPEKQSNLHQNMQLISEKSMNDQKDQFNKAAKNGDSDRCLKRDENTWKSFLRRTEVMYQTESQHTPIWSLATIQPIYQTPVSQRNTFFIQGQASTFSSSQYYNAGVGGRYLTTDEKCILGANVFYDIISTSFQRMGVGVEVFYRDVTLRSNFYQPITGTKTKRTPCPSPCASQFTQSHVHKKEAMQGIDGEIEIPCPFLPWIRLTGGGFYFHGPHQKSRGFSGNAKLYLTKFLRLEGGNQSNNRHASAYGLISLSFGNPPEVEYTMIDQVFARSPFPQRCLARQTMGKVRRQNQVLIAKHQSHDPCSVCSSGKTCPTGLALCNNSCVNLTTDRSNCGTCSHACTANEVCTSGACAACSAPEVACNNSCVNLNSDLNNCGSCGHVCSNAVLCSAGQCLCQAGFINCSNSCVNLNSDPNNCGSCGHACPSGQVCSAGACVSSSCGAACTSNADCTASCPNCDLVTGACRP